MKQRRKNKPTGEAVAPVPAKITRPVLSGVYPRTRLFRRLDHACKSPVIWISGPAGSGKTTVVASYLASRQLPVIWYQMDASDNDVASFFYYVGSAALPIVNGHEPMPLLTPVYVAGISTFTINYFRALFQRAKPGTVLVLDNYQDIDIEGEIQDVLATGFEQIPAGINVIVISRQEASPAFARLRASGRMAVMGWEDLRLTDQESRGIVALRQAEKAVAPTAVDRLNRQAQGWAAGLVLLMERSSDSEMQAPHVTEFASQSIFDYFASEIFRRTDPLTRQFLIKTSFLPKVAPQVAQYLAPGSDSKGILHDLTRRNYFTVKHIDGSYEYHPMFRAFLANRARATFTGEQVRELMQQSAELLADDGDIESAVSLLQEAEEWRGATKLILRLAPVLAAQGRTQTLERWLRALPERLRAENPWVLYWLGTSRLMFAPGEARRYLEQAFALFEGQAEASPLYVVWSRIIESYLFEMNDYTPMIAWLDRYATLKVDRIPPASGIENATLFTLISGLTNVRFDHPDLPSYVERAQRLFDEETEVERRLARAGALISYYFWKGEIAKADALLENMAPNAQVFTAVSSGRLNWYAWKTLHSSTIGNSDESLRATNEGLALADVSGIHVLDLQILSHGIVGQLSARKVAAARALAERIALMKPRGRGEEAIFRYHVSLVALHEGDLARAYQESRRAVELATTSGMFIGTAVYMAGFAYVLARKGDTDAALAALAEGRAKCNAMHSRIFDSHYSFREAAIRLLRGEYEACKAALRTALNIASEIGTSTRSLCLDDDVAALYALALEAGIQTEYVEKTIAKTRLPPPLSLPEKWPWPIRIYALGRFSVVKDGKLLDFGNRAGKKPLELLRMLIALGTRDVPVGRMIEALWPEADGDMAKLSFKTALHRARKLIGERALLLQDGHLSLNNEVCWSDIWAFERALEESDETTQAQRLLSLYRGPFLGDLDSPVVQVQRDRLRTKFLRAVLRAGQTLEAKGDWQEAIVWYEKGVEADPCAEEIYRRLMYCYRQMDRSAEALVVYERCRTALKATLYVEPNAETQRLQREIRGDA